MSAPLVSIVMPAFNAAKTIKQSIESVLSQSYVALELLVVDDGSTDETPDIANVYAAQDGRVRLIFTSGRLGAAGARNVGTSHARGEYLALCDSDDLWHPEKLTRQIEVMRRRDSLICATAYQRIDEQGRHLGAPMWMPDRVSRKDLLAANYLCCASVVYDVRKAGKLMMPDYRQGKLPWYLRLFRHPPLHEDYITWVSLLAREGNSAEAHGLNEVLAFYRVRAGSHSANKLAAALARWHILRNVFGLSVSQSARYFLDYARHAAAGRSSTGLALFGSPNRVPPRVL